MLDSPTLEHSVLYLQPVFTDEYLQLLWVLICFFFDCNDDDENNTVQYLK